MTLLVQLFETPAIQEQLADINEEYIDFKEIIKMMMEASEWKNINDIIKPLTPAMKAKRQAQSQAAQQQGKLATQQTISAQNAQQKAQLQAQSIQGRIQERLIVGAVLNSAKGEANEGSPDVSGLEGSEENVE